MLAHAPIWGLLILESNILHYASFIFCFSLKNNDIIHSAVASQYVWHMANLISIIFPQPLISVNVHLCVISVSFPVRPQETWDTESMLFQLFLYRLSTDKTTPRNRLLF